MNYAKPDALVSTEWLAQHMDAPDVRIVDATWFMPGAGRDARAEYNTCHIPGAVYFDIDDIADSDSPLPHMLPSAEKFSSRMRKLGLGDGNRIAVYDANGGFMAAQRVWWTLRVFGHDDVCVLDGGLPKWLAEERAVEDLPPAPMQKHFSAIMNNTLVRSRDQVLSNLETSREQIIDARSSERFVGSVAEPRPGVRSGCIPGSLNVPFQQVVDMVNHGCMRSADEIHAAFQNAGVDLSKPIVTSCGSGVTASVLAFALHLIGCDDVAVYDGSWSEWGGDDACPVETGN